jgi:hypothetical protein
VVVFSTETNISFFAHRVQNCSVVNPVGNGEEDLFSGLKYGGVKLTFCFLLRLRLVMSGAILLFPPYVFMACLKHKDTFTFSVH